MKYSISVIIPVYNVEQYIERCATSLFKQTLQSIQYIFVNDCSKDRSIEILETIIDRYPQRHSDIKIINHNQNQGLASARNTGRSIAEGEYIIDCDSDDWVDTNAYEILYKKAKQTNADITICGFYYEYENKVIQSIPKKYKTKEEILKDSLNGKLHNSCCNKLVKQELYTNNNIKCIDGINMLEDTFVMTRLIYHARTIEVLPNCLYHYFQGNTNSYTRLWTKKNCDDVIKVTNSLVSYFNNNNKYQIFPEINYLQLNSKIMLLMFYNKKDEHTHHYLYNKSRKYIWSHPNLNIRYKLILYVSSIGLHKTANLLININKNIKRICSYIK